MSLSELRAELKKLRKDMMPTPISRLKKHDVATEIERLRGLHHTEVKKVEAVLKKEDVPKKAVKEVKKVQEVAHKKQEEVVKKAPAKEDSKPVKGSDAMRERMAALRAKRVAKKTD